MPAWAASCHPSAIKSGFSVEESKKGKAAGPKNGKKGQKSSPRVSQWSNTQQHPSNQLCKQVKERMPERRYRRGCGHRCPACWYGRLTKGARKKQLSQTQKAVAMKARRAEAAAAAAKAKQQRK